MNSQFHVILQRREGVGVVEFCSEDSCEEVIGRKVQTQNGKHVLFIYFLEKEADSSEIDENVPTAEEATEATEGNAGSAEDSVDTSQSGVYTEHVFTDPLGVQIPEDLSPVYQSRYTSGPAT